MSRLPAPLNHLPLPIIGSPLFIISNPKLVIAQCKAGVVGAMPALNARPAAQLDDWLAEITESLAAYNQANPDAPAAPFAIGAGGPDPGVPPELSFQEEVAVFASPKRLAIGVALVVPGVAASVAVPTAGVAAVTSPPDPSPAPAPLPAAPSGRGWVGTALALAALAAGAAPTVACYPSFPDAMASVGMIVPRGTTAADAGQVVDAAAAGNVLAIHYDGADGSAFRTDNLRAGGDGGSRRTGPRSAPKRTPTPALLWPQLAHRRARRPEPPTERRRRSRGAPLARCGQRSAGVAPSVPIHDVLTNALGTRIDRPTSV